MDDSDPDADDVEDGQMEGSPGMMDEEEEDEENRDRPIYPWMKKVHVAGVGKSIFMNLVS